MRYVTILGVLYNTEHHDTKQKPPAISQHQPGRSQHQQITKESWGTYGTEVPQS